MALATLEKLDRDERYPHRHKLIQRMKKANVYRLYHCDFCGKAFYYGYKAKLENAGRYLSREKSLFLELRDEDDKIPTDLNELLKLNPGKSDLDAVVAKVGQPFAKHMLDSGILLCYHSDDLNNPHSILIDPHYKVVKLVAIHNDNEAFDLDNLEDAYGQQEFVTRMEGFEFWMYEAYGVAKVTEGFSDEAILFVQFFEKRLDMNRYMEMNCFFEETFMS